MSKSQEKSVFSIPAPIKNFASDIKNTADAPFANIPLKTANDLVIEDMEKPTALFLFKEDFAPNNRLEFHGKFYGKWTAKFNSFLAVSGTKDQPKIELAEEAQLNGPVGDAQIQLKFKPAKVSAQLDFGHREIDTVVKDVTRDSIIARNYWNPYLYYETDRAFGSQLFGLGAVLWLGKSHRGNQRLDIRRKEGAFDWSFNHNSLCKYKGFFYNSFFNATFTDAVQFLSRNVLLGYDREELNANVEVKFPKGSWREWNVEKAQGSVSYDFKERGLIGLISELNQGVTEGKVASDFALGYRNKMSKDLELKMKFSYAGLATFFLNWKIQQGLNLHTSLALALTDKEKKGFLEMPFDLGLKLKLEK